MDENLKLLTARDLAEMWSVDLSTVYRLMRGGEIPTVKFGRCVRVTPADAGEFIKTRRKWQRRINQPTNPN